MKTVNWDGRKWLWPARDTRLKQINEHTNDFHEVLPYLKGTRNAIQAGGAMGMWPYLMSKTFDKVYTFEPSPENYPLLVENIGDIHNIEHHALALGDCIDDVDMKLAVDCNSGTFYTVPSGQEQDPRWPPVIARVKQVDLDSAIPLVPIDFIQLDIEGREPEALRGAIGIIKRWWPVIMLEDNPPRNDREVQSSQVAENFLLDLGYKCVKRIHKDNIFAK